MTAPKKKPSKAAIAKAAKAAYTAKVNTFSVVDTPAPARMLDKTKPTPAERKTIRTAGARRAEWEGSPTGQTRSHGGHVESMIRSGLVDSPAQALGVLRHGQTEASEWMRARTGAHDPTIGPDVPNINEPHAVDPRVVGQRRWEDMHPHEQARTLHAAAQHGVTMDSAKRDYSTQLDQSHGRAWSAGAADPYSSRFYAGSSEPERRISLSGRDNAAHPAAQAAKPAMKVGMRDVQAIANAITSPRNFFDRKGADGTRTFPNDEHATTAIQHVLNNPHLTAQEAHDTVPNSSGPSGGGIHGNIKRAAFVAHQLIYGGKTVPELTNPLTEKQAEKGRTAGNQTFGGPSQQKTTAYGSAWMNPESPDAFLTTDVHTGSGFAAHLGTQKTTSGKSAVEHYIEGVPNIHQLHDHIARTVHAERGLSPSVENARYLHRGQASQWGEQRIQRTDMGEATHAAAYPQQMGGTSSLTAPTHPALTAHLKAAAEASSTAADEPIWSRGDQARADNTQAKRRREGRRIKPVGDVDPGWL